MTGEERDRLLDELLKECKTPEDILGKQGLIRQLTKRAVERALSAEMTEHLIERNDFSRRTRPAGAGLRVLAPLERALIALIAHLQCDRPAVREHRLAGVAVTRAWARRNHPDRAAIPGPEHARDPGALGGALLGGARLNFVPRPCHLHIFTPKPKDPPPGRPRGARNIRPGSLLV